VLCEELLPSALALELGWEQLFPVIRPFTGPHYLNQPNEPLDHSEPEVVDVRRERD